MNRGLHASRVPMLRAIGFAYFRRRLGEPRDDPGSGGRGSGLNRSRLRARRDLLEHLEAFELRMGQGQ
jgi:hypothetical protein